MNELKPSKGEVKSSGLFSYSSQEPWLFRGTIKSNILFGEVYDEERYAQVIKVCALIQDFGHMREGDKTIVGEGGTTLSGGQCARISLAR